MLLLIVSFLALLCWGSFLNVLAYRLVHEGPHDRHRSQCPFCKKTLAWYDLIPLFSWIALHGKCRYCKQGISWLYVLIELLTPLLIGLLYFSISTDYFFAYALFFSALLVTIRTDLETMLISRFVTLFLLPVAFILSFFDMLPLTLTQSIFGAFFGYSVVWIISHAFYWITKKEGIGQGDIDLLAFIGAFTGVYGVWFSLLLGSLTGATLGVIYLHFFAKKTTTQIPFGPFLAFGAITFVLYKPLIFSYLFEIPIALLS